MRLEHASMGAPSYGLLWVSLGALAAGALLGILQPLILVEVGGFGIAAGPSYVGLLFLLCVALLIVVSIVAMFSRGSRDATVPMLAVSGMLSLGMIGGNILASGLDIGFARPRAEPSFIPADPAGAGWTRSGDMLEPRYEHSATLLRDGRVLVVGGYTESRSPMASAELYDPTTGTWSATGSLLVPTAEHVAVLLPGGEVLVLSSAFGQADAEVWNPVAGTFAAADEMTAPRGDGFTATVLADGRVLVTGGLASNADELFASAEIYDPGSDRWTMTAPMGTPRRGHTATLLPDGRVLVAGGMSAGSTEIASAELYDPVTATWAKVAPMQVGRFNHAAVTLEDGRLLVLGGAVAYPTLPAETFNVTTGEWRPAGTLGVELLGQGDAVMIGDGKVLVMGWMSEYELYDPRAPRAQNRAGGDAEHGNGYTATRLSDGKVLVVGGLVPKPSDGSGYMASYQPLATAHLFDSSATR